MTVTLYFSPNGTTKRLATRIGTALGGGREVDLTPFEARYERYTFTPEDVVVVAFPSYYDRLPPVETEIFPRLTGNGARCIGVISFGNNHYETACAQLHRQLAERGFQVVALGAFVAAHCMMRGVAKGRPDKADLIEVDAFAQKVAQKLADGGASLTPPQALALTELMDPPLAPTADKNCIYCMACVNACPVKAIAPKDPMNTDPYRCILCHRCAHVCPEDCRKVRNEAFQGKMELLKAMLMQENKHNYTVL